MGIDFEINEIESIKKRVVCSLRDFNDNIFLGLGSFYVVDGGGEVSKS